MHTPYSGDLPQSCMVETLQAGFGLRSATDNSGGDELSRMYECWSSQRTGTTTLLSTLQRATPEGVNFPDLLPISPSSAVLQGSGSFWSLLGSAVSALSCSCDIITGAGTVQGSCLQHPCPCELAVSEVHVLALWVRVVLS